MIILFLFNFIKFYFKNQEYNIPYLIFNYHALNINAFIQMVDIYHSNEEHEYTLLLKQSLRFRLKDFINIPHYYIVYYYFIH